MPAIGFIETVPVGQQQQHYHSPANDFIPVAKAGRKRSRAATEEDYATPFSATARPHKRAYLSFQQDAVDYSDKGDVAQAAAFTSKIDLPDVNVAPTRDSFSESMNTGEIGLPAVNLAPTDKGTGTIDTNLSACGPYNLPPIQFEEGDDKYAWTGHPANTNTHCSVHAAESHARSLKALSTEARATADAAKADVYRGMGTANALVDKDEVYYVELKQQEIELANLQADADRTHREMSEANDLLQDVVLTPAKENKLHFEIYVRKPDDPAFCPWYWKTVARNVDRLISERTEVFNKAVNASKRADAEVKACEECRRAIAALHAQSSRESSEAVRFAVALGARYKEASLLAVRAEEAQKAAWAEVEAAKAEQAWMGGSTSCASQGGLDDQEAGKAIQILVDLKRPFKRTRTF